MIKKINELRFLIQETLTPLITHDYRYLMMCDHPNIGDTLIMKGEFNFLSTIKNIKCKEYTTMWSFENRHPIIPKEDLLIMRGSGSFGDIWPEAPNFWKFAMKNYPENPILFMPQTIHFNDKKNLDEMANLINNHKKIILCLRDKESFTIAQNFFHCKSYLVPDMAFYMKAEIPTKFRTNNTSRTLLVKREDKEFKKSFLIDELLAKTDVTVSDWPTLKKNGMVERFRKKLINYNFFNIYDLFIKHIYSKYIICQGRKFLMPYSKIYATRMHAGIFAMMMGKETFFLDNNYGKLRKLYETWLSDIDNVSLEV